MATFIGTNAAEIINPTQVSGSVVVTPPGSMPGAAVDIINSGGGADDVDGGGGNDVVNLGAGIDTYRWNTGGGADTIEGGTESDTLVFTRDANTKFLTLSAVGGRTRLLNDVSMIALDINDVETVTFNQAGDGGIIRLFDLTGTDVTTVNVAFSSVFAFDSVWAYGSALGTTIAITGSGASMTVTGLPAMLHVTDGAPGDEIRVFGEDGNDTINAAGYVSQAMSLQLIGGGGNDTIIGGTAADSISGGDDNDAISGGLGNDGLDGGIGNDAFFWKPGDGADSVGGNLGVDALTFRGTMNGQETLVVGGGASAFAVYLDINGPTQVSMTGIETVVLYPMAGGDEIIVNPFTGSTISRVDIDLDGTPGGAVNDDGAFDLIDIRGSSAFDDVTVATIGGVVAITGSMSNTFVRNFAANDRIVIDALAGNDTIDLSGFTSTIEIIVRGSHGDDTLIGSAGHDVLEGGVDNDRLDGRGGADTLNGNLGSDVYVIDSPGDTVVELGTHIDTIETAMTFSLAPAGFQLVENLILTGTGNVNGTGNASVNLIVGNGGANALVGGAGIDTLIGQAGNDTYVLQADADVIVDTAGVDKITSTITRSLANYSGIENLVLVGAAAANATGNSLANTLIGNGAANVLRGSGGNDTLIGGLGNDTLIGGPGNDLLVFNSAPNGTTNRDAITGFEVPNDTIQLENGIFAGLGAVTGVLGAAQFAINNNNGLALDATDRVIYDQNSGQLWYDSNGNVNGGTIVNFATIGVGLALTNADFLIA